MGQRATLFVVAEAGTELYYSHWRANTLDRDLFWGPEVATAFARAQRSEAEGASLLDDVWCEGAAVVDHTMRTLLWFGGEGTCYSVPRRRLYCRMMRFFWPGWTILWAYEGSADIADYLGIPQDRVCRADYHQSENLPAVLDTPENPGWSSTMISIRQEGRTRFLATTSDLEFL